MPGAFKLDHLQPLKPTLLLEFSICCTFILGGQFLLPQRANTEKREILSTFKMDETEGFEWLGHSNWTKCKHMSKKISKNFQSSRPLYWGLPFLITPGWRKGKMQKVVSHPSTNRAKHCLTSVVGRALVLPSVHGLCQDTKVKTGKEEMQSWVSRLRFLEAKSGIQCLGHPN